MADIARLAGISIGSVSRALSGSTEVSEATRTRVLELAKSLNYTVNAGARNLRRGRSQTIAVISPLLGDDNQHLTDPFLWGLVGSIVERLTERRYRVLLSRVQVDEVDIAEAVETGAADGLILTGQWLPHQRLNELAVSGVPFTVWGAEQARQLYSTVGTDNRSGGRMATEHLLDQGARTIAFVGDLGSAEINLRYQGYLDAHSRRRLPIPTGLSIPVTFDPIALQAQIRALVNLGARFDGVVAASDMAAITVMRELASCGIVVPRDVLVVGYDDIPAAELVTPSLTTIRQSLAAAGAGLVDGLLDQLAGNQPANVTVPCELIRRSSSQASK